MAMPYWPVLIPRQASAFADTRQDQLRVMTFNINFNNHNVEGVAELIAMEQPDIIAFQEMTEVFATVLHDKIGEAYPYQSIDHSWALKMIIMSRYPIEAQPKHPDAVRAQHALISTPSGPVMMWNVHPNPAVSSGWEAQRALLALVAQDVAEEERPVIVLGDFNSTDQSENYRLIANHLSDVHWTVGQGFGFTFPDFSGAIEPDQPWYIQTMLQVRPLVKIDHIFVSQHFTPRSTYVVSQSYGSDHLPVVAELIMR
jgi:vancomycin resistance protein VanJ